MAIDPSIPLQAASNQPNALQAFGQIQGLQSNMLQARAMNQQFQANVAASQAIKGATDPQTGKINYDQVAASLSQGPGAYNLPALQGQILDQQKKQQDIGLGHQELLQKINQAYGQMGSLLIEPDLGKSDIRGKIYQTIVDTYKTGLVGDDPAKLQDMINSVPTDPTQQKLWVQQNYLKSHNASQQAFQALSPTITNINTGGAQTLVNTNPAAGPVGQAVGTYQNTMTPGEANSQVTVYDPATGTQRIITKQQFADQANGAQPQQPQPQPAASPAAVSVPVQQGAGPHGDFHGNLGAIRNEILSMPDGPDKTAALAALDNQVQSLVRGGNPQQPQAQVASPAQQPASRPIGLQAAPAIGMETGVQGIAKGGSDRYNTLSSNAENVRNTTQGYDRALQALDALGTSGPQVNNVQKIKATMEALGLKPTGQDTADWQSLKKYLANAAAQASAAAGFSGSDARAASFGAGQPDPNTMNSTSLREAINYVKAQNNGVLAKQQAATAFLGANNNDTTKYPQFEARWNKTYNPDVMYFVSLPDDQKGKYFQSLPKSKQSQIQSGYNAMHALGAF